MTPADRTAPWRPIDRVAVVLGNLAGVAAILAAYAGGSHEATADRQVGWVNVGIAGLMIVAVANAGWLLAGRRACWRLRHNLLPAEPGAAAWPATGDVPAPARSLPRDTFLAAAAMTWYHAAECRMVAGKDVAPASEAEHRAAGRRPCAVCLPASTEGAPS
jgi:hypothetical protein